MSFRRGEKKRLGAAAAMLLLFVCILGGCAGAGTPAGRQASTAVSTQSLPEAETAGGTGLGAGMSTGGKPSGGTEEPPFDEPEITLVMVGDMLMHTEVTESGRREDGSFQYEHLFTYMRDRIREADLALVNEEVILGGEELGLSGYPSFNAPYEVGDALVDAGFDVVLHATNHTLDKGKKGILNCLSYWEEKHPEIAVLGIQDSGEKQDEIYCFEKNGITLAILNYTYGTNGIALPEDMPYLVNVLDSDRIRADVAKAKEKADFVILCPHWGTEYIHTVSKSQRKWAELFLECGVDLVLGTHPHVIEPAETITGADGRHMVVYYSLGNYVNCTSSEGKGVADRMLGAMAEVTVARNEDGEVYVKEYGAEPLVTYVSADKRTVTTYPFSLFTEELAGSSVTVCRDVSFGREYLRRIWEEVFPGWPMEERAKNK